MPAALDCIRHCGGHDGASLRPKALAVVDAALQLQQAGFSSLGGSGSRGAAEQHAVEMRGDGGGRFISCTQNEGSSSTVTAKQVPAQRDAGVDVVGQQRDVPLDPLLPLVPDEPELPLVPLLPTPPPGT